MQPAPLHPPHTPFLNHISVPLTPPVHPLSHRIIIRHRQQHARRGAVRWRLLQLHPLRFHPSHAACICRLRAATVRRRTSCNWRGIGTVQAAGHPCGETACILACLTAILVIRLQIDACCDSLWHVANLAVPAVNFGVAPFTTFFDTSFFLFPCTYFFSIICLITALQKWFA